MHRSAIRVAAFGRSPSELTRAGSSSLRASSLCQFSTTPSRFDDGGDDGSNPQPPPPSSQPQSHQKPAAKRPTGRQRSAAAVSQLGQLRSSIAKNIGIDARAMSAPIRGRGAQPGSAPSSSSSPNIISVSSLPRRGGGRGGKFFRRPDDGPASAGFGGGPRFGGSRTPGSGTDRPGFSRGRGRGGFGAGRGGARGRGRGRGDGSGRGRGRGRRRNENGRQALQEEASWPSWTAEERQWISKTEKGEAVEYKPSGSLEALLGHGPAVPSAGLGSFSQVETALRSMRILAGGNAFSETAYPHLPSTVGKSLEEGRPVFFSTKEEREWAVKNLGGGKGEKEIKAADEVTKDAILETAIQGKHAAPAFAPASNILGTLSSYHARDGTYRAEDSRAFDAKVASLLRVQKGAVGKGNKAKAARA